MDEVRKVKRQGGRDGLLSRGKRRAPVFGSFPSFLQRNPTDALERTRSFFNSFLFGRPLTDTTTVPNLCEGLSRVAKGGRTFSHDFLKGHRKRRDVTGEIFFAEKSSSPLRLPYLQLTLLLSDSSLIALSSLSFSCVSSRTIPYGGKKNPPFIQVKIHLGCNC